MEKILIFGHRKPDTDAVCGTISLSYLKSKMGLNVEPRILSEINSETEYALKKFNIPIPKYLNDVRIQLKDVKYKKNLYINENASIYEAFNYLTTKGITGIPLVDDKKTFVGYVSLKEIANEFVINDSNVLNTSFDSIAKTLEASKTYKFDDYIEGNVMAVTLPYRLFMESVKIDHNSVLIVGNREHIIDYALKNKIKLLVIINNVSLTR